MKMLKSKKGMDLFIFLVGVFGIIMLIVILFALFTSYDDLKRADPEPLGYKATEILSTYQEADKALLYIDESAQQAIEKALHRFGQNGLQPTTGSECGSASVYQKWSKGAVEPTTTGGMSQCQVTNTECTPKDFEKNYLQYFSEELNKKISDYKGGLPQTDDYQLTLQSKNDATEIKGTAKSPITIKKAHDKTAVKTELNYKIKPSFRERIDIDAASDFLYTTSNGAAINKKDENTIKQEIENLNSENPKLEWALNGLQTECQNTCNTGESCTTNCHFEKDEPKCNDDDFAEEGEFCPRHEVCETGTVEEVYCSHTAYLQVKIKDDRYKLPGEAEGYRKTPYGNLEYWFALNWMDESPVKSECVV